MNLQTEPIYVLDDNEDQLQRTIAILRDGGFQSILPFVSPDFALRSMEERLPSLVISEMNFKDRTGLDVLHHVKLAAKGSHIKTLLVVGDEPGNLVRRAFELGAWDILQRPFERVSTVQRVKNAIASSGKPSFAAEDVLTTGFREIIALLAIEFSPHESITSKQESQQRNFRVAALCEQIATEFGLPANTCVEIGLGSYFYELGSWCQSQGKRSMAPLSWQEIETLKQIPIRGAAILARSRGSLGRTAREMILSSKENWNGSGYPAGLAGTKIPIAARIGAVASAFEKITHPRMTEQGHGQAIEEAVEWIQKQAGIQFDPDVVDAFFRVIVRENVHLAPKAA